MFSMNISDFVYFLCHNGSLSRINILTEQARSNICAKGRYDMCTSDEERDS